MSGWKVCPEYRCDPGDKAFPARTDSSRSWHYLHSYRASLHRLSTGKLRSFTIPILSSVNRYAKSTVPLSAPPCDMLVGSNAGELRAIERRDSDPFRLHTRSEVRREGKQEVRTFKTRCAQTHKKQKKQI